MEMNPNPKTEIATFAAGCFWGVQLEFNKMFGVLQTKAGYTGGQKNEPGYYEVCEGRTGHAEAVEIHFDPSVVSFEDLAREFFNLHDPTTLNRQGPDVGDQYRSAIFYHSPEQRATAEQLIKEVDESGEFVDRVVTQVLPAEKFWDAEDYHQHYFAKRGMASCHIRRK